MNRITIYIFLLVTIWPVAGFGQINREKVVRRHIVHVNSIDSLSSLTVGNGKFAFTVDFTGLQSFPELFENGNTSWHPVGMGLAQFSQHKRLFL